MQNIIVHEGERSFLFLNTLKISLAPTLQEGSLQVMFVGTHNTQEQIELKTCERDGQNAAKISSALAHALNFLGQ